MKKRWMVALILMAGAMYGQSVQAGRAVRVGEFQSQGGSGTGGPLTYSARTDAAVFGTGVAGELLPAACGGVAACLANAYNASATAGHQGAALSYTGSATMAPPAAGSTVSGTNINGLNSYLNGVNSAAMPAIDPDFGTLMYRATDFSFYNNVDCLGGGSFGSSFNMGSSGSTRAWSAIDAHGWRKLLIQTSGGTKVMVHFNPANGTVIPTNLCGGYLPGATSNSGTGPAVIYTANNDQENTIVFSSMTGIPTDAETPDSGCHGCDSHAVRGELELSSRLARLARPIRRPIIPIRGAALVTPLCRIAVIQRLERALRAHHMPTRFIRA